MKKLLAALLLVAALSAHAKADDIVRVSSTPTVAVDVASATPTNLTGGDANGWRRVCIQNLDLTYALYASVNVNVSSITTNSAIGTVIAPASDATHPSTPMCFTIPAGANFYARTGSVSGTTRASVVLAR